MRPEPSVLHLDLDAFFAAVEQRDKPSLRGKPVVVGGVGGRGVVATASYEARVFGVRSAMPTHEAHRRCPHAAFLTPRFGAYKVASEQVMGLLRALSPRVEPLSLDEAFVDLRTAERVSSFAVDDLTALVAGLRAEVADATGGLTASVGVASSKLMAKVASELAKPDGVRVVPAGGETALLAPMPVGTIPGVGPVTADKLGRLGLRTVGQLQQVDVDELAQVVGRNAALALVELAHARDDRPVVAEREAKSISVEDTFERDLTDPVELAAVARRDARQVARRLAASGLFARTVVLKLRRHDFSTLTRSRTLLGATDRAEVIGEVAAALLDGVDVTTGVRLLGVGVSGLTDVLQEDLFAEPIEAVDPSGPAGSLDVGAGEVRSGGLLVGAAAAGLEPAAADTAVEEPALRHRTGWPPGADVEHDTFGAGWVWGAGVGRVTVRFETRDTPPGPVRTFRDDDPTLRLR